MRRIAQALIALFLVSAAVPALASPPITVLEFFTGANGDEPANGVIQGSDGFLYGTTASGGTNNDGTLFKIDNQGNNFSDPVEFAGLSAPLGGFVACGVIQGSDGNLYGMATSGGANNNGVIFKVAPDGTGYTDLYDFAATNNITPFPVGSLIQGSDGNLYGVTDQGGASNSGTIFKISTSGGSITILHTFDPGGLNVPAGGLVEGEDGSLYGTAAQGGPNLAGGVYRINLDGTGYAVLYTFLGSPNDGATPSSPLVSGGDGFLYGTTAFGETIHGTLGDGTVFKIAPDGSGYKVLREFGNQGTPNDGFEPGGHIALANDGNLYGTTVGGGLFSTPGVGGVGGTIYELSRDGITYNQLQSFDGTDGESVGSGLLQGTDGAFYGATPRGNTAGNQGTLFSFNTGLPASVTGLYALGSDAQTQLFWTSNPAATTYKVYRSTTTGGEGNTPYATGLVTPQFFDNNVSQGTPYFYQVTAVVSGEETAKSYEVTSTPMMSIAASGGLSATPNPIPGGKTTTGTMTLTQATTGPTTAFLSSDNPLVTFASPDLTVPANQPSGTFTINTSNTGSAYTATITASENGTDATTTVNVTVPSILHTFQSGLQMISGPTNDTGETLPNIFAQSNPLLAVWTGAAYAITPTAPSNTIVPGQGYWFHPTSATNLYDIGVDQPNSSAVNVPLVQGWNMIGNPFGIAVPATDLQVSNGQNTVSFLNGNTDGLVGNTLYTWQTIDAQYEVLPASSSTLEPYTGYWLFAFKPCTLIFPAGG